MSRVTIKNLNDLVDMLNNVTDNPIQPYMRTESGHTVAQVGNFHLSQAYGGIALHQMVDGGGVCDVFKSGHVSKKELHQQIQAFIDGARYAKTR